MKLFLAVCALCVLSLTTYIYADIASQPASTIISTQQSTAVDDTAAVVTIVRTNRGYEPAEIAIELGTVVVWKNESSKFHWPASNEHPSHEAYPEFDSKRAIAPGDEWRFTFNEVGEWKFHDHIQANIGGVIFVEDPNEGAFSLEDGQVLDAVEQ